MKKRKNHMHGFEHWPEDLRRICFAIRRGDRVVFTRHFREQLVNRGIALGELFSIFKNGTAEIIQGHAVGTYPLGDGKFNRDPLRVVYGVTDTGKTIHVVIALKNPLLFITVYFPDPEIFEPDLKTLRKEFRFKEIY